MRSTMPGDPRSEEACVVDVIAFAEKHDRHGVEMVLGELDAMGFSGKIAIDVRRNPLALANKGLIEKGIEKLNGSFQGALAT